MTKYLNDSFSVNYGGSKEYRDNWDRIFGGKEPETVIEKSDIRKQVEEFHTTFGHPVNAVPAVPSDDQVKLRFRLISEEYLEFLESLNVTVPQTIKDYLMGIADNFRGEHHHLDLVALADALADLDYVVEGTRLAFGINGKPIADEVHRSNMSKADKDGTVYRNANGKTMKGPDYSPPDIAGELKKQVMQ